MHRRVLKTVYNQRVREVLRRLEEGEGREELAKEFGLANWKSLDMYMRRKGFRWRGKQGNYFAAEEADVALEDIPKKAEEIISYFKNRKIDPMIVSENMGFEDHREMAAYMKDIGLGWNHDLRNYTMQNPAIRTDVLVKTSVSKEKSQKEGTIIENGDIQSMIQTLYLQMEEMINSMRPIIDEYNIRNGNQ